MTLWNDFPDSVLDGVGQAGFKRRTNACLLAKAALSLLYTLSGRIGKVVSSHAAVARSSPAEVSLIYTMHEGSGGTAH